MTLFEQIHYNGAYPEREYPATVEEFVKFGLTPDDYAHYVGLQHKLQSELLLNKYAESYDEFILFCKDKKLIDKYNDFSFKLREDAEYFWDYFRYPRESSEFRLLVERQLSLRWDEEAEYLYDLGIASFEYDSTDFDSPLRLKKYIPEEKKLVILNHKEIKDIFEIVKKEKSRVDKEVEKQIAKMPHKEDANAIVEGFPWIKQLYKLLNRQTIVEDVYEEISQALNATDIYHFNENDFLYVFCNENTCREDNHHLSKMSVEFKFYGKPEKRYSIERCAHCKRFQISLNELTEMFDSYGVPQCRIIYDDEKNGSFSDFATTSIFNDMGYTVSQSAGLSSAKRQAILKYAIDSGKVSKYRVLSYLRQRMNINGMKEGNEVAFYKWKEDYEYIRTL